MDFPKGYLESIPPIYKDVLAAFPRIDPSRKKGYGLAVSTIYANLENMPLSPGEMPYSIGEIREACRKMAVSGVVEIQNQIFVCPTELGEELIASLTKRPIAAKSVPDFPSPPRTSLAEALIGNPKR